MVKPEDISKDKLLSAVFREQGYYTIPFLEPGEASSLISVLHELHTTTPDNPIYHSYIHHDVMPVLRIHEVISSMITPLLPRLNLAIPFRIITAVFIDKAPAAGSRFDLHTDDSLCDERYFTQVNIWIPLTDVSYRNGTMCICNGTHRDTPIIRADSCGDPYIRKHQDALLEHFTPIELKAGEALVYNPGCIHFSPPNTSEQNRPVVVCVLIPENAELCIFQKQKRLFGKDLLVKYPLSMEQFTLKTPLDTIKPSEKIRL